MGRLVIVRVAAIVGGSWFDVTQLILVATTAVLVGDSWKLRFQKNTKVLFIVKEKLVTSMLALSPTNT